MRIDRPLALLVAVTGLFGVAASPAGATTITVSGAGDAALAGDGECTLREAITTANDNSALEGAGAGDCAAGEAGPAVRDVIEFSIGAGVQTIAPATALPTITDRVEIDGRQGSEVASAVRIELDGSAIGAGTHHGLFLSTGSDGSYVHNIAVYDFPDDGIHLFGDESTVEWAIVGMDQAGTEASANGANGVTIRGERNLVSRSAISGNAGHGIEVLPRSGANGAENTIRASRIGTAKGGGSAVANQGDGVHLSLDTLAAGGDDLEIGGPGDPTPGGICDGACNVISGNAGEGIEVRVGGEGAERTTGLTIQGNHIGSDAAGTAALPNQGDTGLKIWGGTSGASVEGNVISGNAERGVMIVAGSSGVGAAGTTFTGNAIGLGSDRDTVVANGTDGILISRDLTNGPQISGTTIGGPEGPTPGGICDGDCNVISGNGQSGIVLLHSLSFAGGAIADTEILGNHIGTDASGTVDRGNGTWGIQLSGVSGTTVGRPDSPNVISGNGQSGVLLVSGGTNGNAIQANLIGLAADGAAPLGNDEHGVDAGGGGNFLNAIGGTGAGLGNEIAHNGKAGVVLLGGADPAVDTPILGNSVHSNGELGIDLRLAPLAAGVTENGACEEATGANRCQEFPLPTAAAGGGAAVAGTLESAPGRSYRVEVFASSVADPSGNGEGERFLGAVTVATDGGGDASWLFADPAASLADGEVATATATELGGGAAPLSTSELSDALAAPACHLEGGEGADELDGGAGDEVICGFGAGDTLSGGPGRDAVLGGGGGDTIDVADGEADALVDCGPGTDTVEADDAATDPAMIFLGCETVNRPGSPAPPPPAPPPPALAAPAPLPAPAAVSTGDTEAAGEDRVFKCKGRRATIVGTGKKDTIKGTGKADVIVALGGNDTIQARRGDDVVCAGKGNDTVRGGPGEDLLRGDAGRDRLFGERGNDRLHGGGARDVVKGGPGDDRLKGAAGGGDVCDGQAGREDKLDGRKAGCEKRRGIP